MCNYLNELQEHPHAPPTSHKKDQYGIQSKDGHCYVPAFNDRSHPLYAPPTQHKQDP